MVDIYFYRLRVYMARAFDARGLGFVVLFECICLYYGSMASVRNFINAFFWPMATKLDGTDVTSSRFN